MYNIERQKLQLMPAPADAAKLSAKGILIITKLRNFSRTKAVLVHCITFNALGQTGL